MPQYLRLRQRKSVRDGEMREIEDLSPSLHAGSGRISGGGCKGRRPPVLQIHRALANTRPRIRVPTKRPWREKTTKGPRCLGAHAPHWEFCIGTKRDGPDRPRGKASARGQRGPLERQAQVAHGGSTPSRRLFPPGAAPEGHLMENSPPASPLTYFLRRV